MPHIVILSASVRIGRISSRVALFFKDLLGEKGFADAEIVDLSKYAFPVFEERLKYQPVPPAGLLDYASRIRSADGIIIVTPEYNGGYPASLKNAIDVLYEEWHRKPVAIATVSDGSFGGTQVITSLQFTLWKIRAWTVPAMFPVPNAPEKFDEQGRLLDDKMLKRADNFVKELMWCITARSLMNGK